MNLYSEIVIHLCVCGGGGCQNLLSKFCFSNITVQKLFNPTRPFNIHGFPQLPPSDMTSQLQFIGTSLSYLGNMSTDGSPCLRSHSKRDYGIQGVIWLGNIDRITAPWGDMLKSNADCWESVKIDGKNRGIVTTKMKNISKGTISAMYGGVIFD